MSKAQDKRDAQARSLALLRSMLAKGATVSTVHVHTSRSGMLRTFRTLVVEDGVIRDMSPDVARALGWAYDRDRGAVRVNGCGMDMSFHLVYSLSRVLWDDGYALNARKV